MDNKKTKNFVIISIIVTTIVSLIVALIIGKNLSQDTSQKRFKLTKDYKKFKDQDFRYDRERGRKVYLQVCSRCHGSNGQGQLNYPSLTDSPLIKESKKLIKLSLYGLQGEIIRGEKTYNGIMPGFKNLPHEDLAHALTYITKNFGKTTSEIPTVEIIKGKIDYIERKSPYRVEEL